MVGFTDGVRQGSECDPRGYSSGVWIFFQNEYARYDDSDAHYHNAVDSYD